MENEIRSAKVHLASRREFLRTAAIGTGAAMLAVGSVPVEAGERQGLIDVNVNLGHWPGRRLPQQEPDRLVAKLRSRQVTQAWTGTLDGLLHKNVDAANERLAEVCRRYGRGLLLPFGSINPVLPGWEEDLRRCVEIHQFSGIRLHPNYHGYRLDNPAFARLLSIAAEREIVVQLALVMEDERMMHPRLRVEPVDITPLGAAVSQTPGVRLVLLNALRTVRGEQLRQLVAAAEICVEISMLEGAGGVESLLKLVPVERILFGSHAPLFYFEAAELKLKESPLTPDQVSAIRAGNARRVLCST